MFVETLVTNRTIEKVSVTISCLLHYVVLNFSFERNQNPWTQPIGVFFHVMHCTCLLDPYFGRFIKVFTAKLYSFAFFLVAVS